MPVFQDPNDQMMAFNQVRSILSGGTRGAGGPTGPSIRRGGEGGNPIRAGVQPAGGDNMGQTQFPVQLGGNRATRAQAEKNAALMGQNAQAYQGQMQQALSDFHDELQQTGGDTRKALMNAFVNHPEHFANEDVFKGVLGYAQTLMAPAAKPTVVGQGASMYDEQGNLLAHNPAAPREVAPGGALVNPENGSALFRNPDTKTQEGQSGTGAKWTLADQRTIEAGTQLLDNASTLRANAHTTGFFTGALRALQATKVGAAPDQDTQAFQGALTQSRAAILGLGNNPRLKVATQNMLDTLPGTSESTSYNLNEAIPRHTLSVRNFLADRIAEFKADGKALPPSLLSQMQQYNFDPDYMNRLNTALSDVRNKQNVSPDDIRVIAGEAKSPGTMGVPMSDFTSAIQQGRQMHMIDDATWNAYATKYPELGQPVQPPAPQAQ